MDGVLGPLRQCLQHRDGGLEHGQGHLGVGLGLFVGVEVHAVFRQGIEEVHLLGDVRQLFTAGL